MTGFRWRLPAFLSALAALALIGPAPLHAQASAKPQHSGDRIEAITDLPDRAPYGVEGEFFDLGFQPATGQYVLFRRDRVIRLDNNQLAAISADLGHDPIERWQEQRALAAAQGGLPAYVWALIASVILLLAGAGYWLWRRGDAADVSAEPVRPPETPPGMDALQDRIDGPTVPASMRVEKQKRGGLM